MQRIRTSSLTRRAAAMVLAILALGIAAPVAAYSQEIGPTDEQYENGILGEGASGDVSDSGASGTDGDVAGVSSSGGSSGGSEIGELPFTGLDVAAIAAIGAGLLGAGLLIRRAARTGQHPTI